MARVNLAKLEIILILTVFVPIVTAHPQCLDFRPPFTPSSNLTFCPQYSEVGCCTTNKDLQLHQEYNSMRLLMDEQTWTRCQSYVRTFLCQKCSPYAVHIFDAEVTMRQKLFPGLCQEYCERFYDSCIDIVQYFDQQLSANHNASRSGFCNAVKLTDVDYCFPNLLTNSIFSNKVSNQQITGEGCLCMEEVASELRNPIVARHAGDRTGRLFIAEQLGFIHIYFPLNKTKLEQPFLDISLKVKTSPRRGDERGFLGLAFHPEYARNGKFYVYYSTSLDLGESRSDYGPGIPIDHKIRISEFMVSTEDPNVANPSSERIIIEVHEPYWNHNGGEILFGDDGYLYIFVGDGGYRGDFHGFSQNKSVLLGKVLRVDVNTNNTMVPYTIPSDNPFRFELNSRPEIYAYGVRNIWRCGKDKGDSVTGEGRGRIVCGDVGQSAYEELDIIRRGVNYGWNAREGFACYDNSLCGQIGPEELPIHAYPHSVGKSVTGGSFYRGCESPNLNGMYLYGDYFRGRLFRLVQNSTGQWDNKEVFMCGTDICLNGLIGHYERFIISFGEDEEGEVYMLSTGKESATANKGKVYKFVDPARRGNPETCPNANSNGPDSLPNHSTTMASTLESRSSERTSSSSSVNSAPSIQSIHVRTCAMASTLLCTITTVR